MVIHAVRKSRPGQLGHCESLALERRNSQRRATAVAIIIYMRSRGALRFRLAVKTSSLPVDPSSGANRP